MEYIPNGSTLCQIPNNANQSRVRAAELSPEGGAGGGKRDEDGVAGDGGRG